MSKDETVRVLVSRDGDAWVAQCVDYDIGAQAKDLVTLRGRLEAVLRAELEESLRRSKTGTPFDGIPKAPPHYETLWNKTSNRLTDPSKPTHAVRREMPPVELALCA